METQEESTGLEAAQALFEAEDTAEPEAEPQPPKPVLEAEVAEPPKPETAEPAEVEAKKPDDFVEFTTPQQKERFNNVFGYGKRLERELQALQDQLGQARDELGRFKSQPVAAPVAPQPESTFAEPKPKLAQFEDADQWGDALAEWSARKASQEASHRWRQEFSQQETQRQKQEVSSRQQQYEEARIHEGRQKYGHMEFDNLSAEVANFVTPVMRDALFQSKAFPAVVVELGKNLQEADRISRLSPYDQIYELKALERRISTQQELKTKEQQLKPTKVEAPGQGEAPKTTPSLTKLRNAAYGSGTTGDFAKYIEAMDI